MLLNDVMDTMLQRAGEESQEYTGPTKVTVKSGEARLAKIFLTFFGLFLQFGDCFLCCVEAF
jgi:hypothetical protein